MRSPPRKPTASGSSKSSFHFKTPDGAGTSPAPPFSFPAPQQKAGIPGGSQRGYSLCSRRGQFPLRGKGKESLAQSPLPLRPPPETWGTPPYTVTAIRFPALMGRQSCRFLESGPLHPPLAALSPLSPIPPRGTKGRDCGPSPLETPPGDEGRGRKNQPPRGRRTRNKDKAGNGPGSA